MYNRDTSLYRTARNYVRSTNQKNQLQHKFRFLQEMYLRQLENVNFYNIALTDSETPTLQQFENRQKFYKNMCEALRYLEDILRNASKISRRRLSNFLQHLLFDALPKYSSDHIAPFETRSQNLDKVLFLLRRLVESYENHRSSGNAVDNTAFGTRRRGRNRSHD